MSNPSRLLPVLAVALVGLVPAGCATSGPAGDRGDPNLLTTEEIRGAEGSTLYDVVQRLRPRWLREVRNRQDFDIEGGVVVYQNQTFLGGPDVLREWGRDFAARMVYLDGISASNQLPGPAANQHVEGAIVIYTR